MTTPSLPENGDMPDTAQVFVENGQRVDRGLLAAENADLQSRLDAKDREIAELRDKLELSQFANRHNSDYMDELDDARKKAFTECADLRTRLEQERELTELKQGIIEAADVRIRELAGRLEQAERERDAMRPVVDAAIAFYEANDSSKLEEIHARYAVWDAADSYRASLPTPKQGDKSV